METYFSKISKVYENVKPDIGSILILTVLYIIQGVPMGLASMLQIVLRDRVHYSALGVLSLAVVPFSVKLLWAPIVDSVYWPSFGRRKSWLIPTQLIAAVAMILGSSAVNKWLGEYGDPPNVFLLMLFFTLLFFLMASQDISVDGWCLTMLSKENVRLGATCNAVGQLVGASIANIGYLTLSSPNVIAFLTSKDPSEVTGLTLGTFVRFFGYAILCVTVIVGLFKAEEPVQPYTRVEVAEPGVNKTGSDDDEDISSTLGVVETYKKLLEILQLRPMRPLLLYLLTSALFYGAVDAAGVIKVIEWGYSKEMLAAVMQVITIQTLLVPIFLSTIIKRTNALKLCATFQLAKVVLSALSLIALRFVAKLIFGVESHSITIPYFALLASSSLIDLLNSGRFITIMQFFTTIADHHIGGTYLTFLNTISNLGPLLARSVSFFVMDFLTFETKTCSDPTDNCTFKLDGFYVLTAINIITGLVYFKLMWPTINHIQAVPHQSWSVLSVSNKTNNTPEVCKKLN